VGGQVFPSTASKCLIATIALLLSAVPVASLGPAVDAELGLPAEVLAWSAKAADPAALRDAMSDHTQKTPPEFAARLKYALADGALRVMVALNSRDASIEAFVESASQVLLWYGNAPRFYALASPDDVESLFVLTSDSTVGVMLTRSRRFDVLNHKYSVRCFMRFSS